ncbi:GDSL esterase/lipase EXL3-like [Magnolia sinica]|uniref:GDSL esterase/lipase EXL3-like n=1 Tax=Magnolia sinica TaxID=86752 RepID=UPI00265882C8|nr:GDSL esterase/lipase EXL3-like [Magnolia sinica]
MNLASELGIKELLPAYLDPTVEIQVLVTGVSFASAGSGYDNLTAEFQVQKLVLFVRCADIKRDCNPGNGLATPPGTSPVAGGQCSSVIPVWKQLEWLGECLKRMTEEVGEDRVEEIVAHSLYGVILGSNDLLVTYFSTHFRKVQYEPPAYVRLLVDAASNVVKELYGMGARKIAVVGSPPLGCLPFQRTVGGGALRECDESVNNASMIYNSQLSKAIKSLAAQLEGSKVVYVDIYTLMFDIINHPQNYGNSNPSNLPSLFRIQIRQVWCLAQIQ